MAGHDRLHWRWKLALGTVLAMYGVVLWGQWGHGRVPGLFADPAGQRGSLRWRVGLGRGGEVPGLPIEATGKGITAGHVEGQHGDYLPNTRDAIFSGVRITPRSGQSKVNGHAQYTSKVIYGNAGLAPGIEEVFFYTSAHWMGSAVLRSGSINPPTADGRRVFSHSWIGDGHPYAANILRRLDYLIDQEDVMVVVGVNNGSEKPVPALLASAYNTIAVGLDTGGSSGGYTTFEGAGRCKPEIVAPRGRTSYSTPVVASIVARLLERADAMGGDAAFSEVIKAVLLAGAEKTEHWQPRPGKPLDERLGAGLVRYDRSDAVLTTGPLEEGGVGGERGWAFGEMAREGTGSYGIETEEVIDELSVVLVWNRRVDGRQIDDLLTGVQRWVDTPRLADFDLRLVALDDRGLGHSVSQSVSEIDNVEHIYLAGLPPGRYRFEITRKDGLIEPWEYAVAWHGGRRQVETASR